MDNRYIGVFDSGIGGLTTVREIMRVLPKENIVYFGDTARVPYGTRSNEKIIEYVEEDITFLINQDVKLVVSACGTASSVALKYVKEKFPVPIIGVVEPAAKKAAEVTKNGRIGVLGTPGTISSGEYSKAIKRINPQMFTIEKACPMFVPIVENGYSDTEIAKIVATEYLECLKSVNVDTIILGCTHYPLLKKVIGDIMGTDVMLIDSGAEVTESVKKHLEKLDILSESKKREQYRFFVSDLSDMFINLGSVFLQRDLTNNVHKVSVGK